MGISPTIATIGVAVLVAHSFDGGFTINEWRNSGKIGQLESVNPVLIAANDRCAIDITGFRRRSELSPRLSKSVRGPQVTINCAFRQEIEDAGITARQEKDVDWLKLQTGYWANIESMRGLQEE